MDTMQNILTASQRLVAHYARRFSRFAEREHDKIQNFEKRVRRIRGIK